MRRIKLLLTLAVLLAAPLARPASAEVSEAERAARWTDLREQIFGERPVADGAGLLAIEAPDRAADAALVPVRITVAEPLRGKLSQLYFVVDENPSPLAGRFAFGPAADRSFIATRVRVNDYTYLHAVAETADGKLYGVARFIKAAGGCSAPAGKDQALAMERLGRMKLALQGAPRVGAPVSAHLLISHPNNSGMQMDQLTRNYIPADFLRQTRITYNGELVLALESDISISEDPSFTFGFVPSAPSGELKAEIADSNDRHFEESWPVRPVPGS